MYEDYVCDYCEEFVVFLSAGDEGWHVCDNCGVIEGPISEYKEDE